MWEATVGPKCNFSQLKNSYIFTEDKIIHHHQKEGKTGIYQIHTWEPWATPTLLKCSALSNLQHWETILQEIGLCIGTRPLLQWSAWWPWWCCTRRPGQAWGGPTTRGRTLGARCRLPRLCTKPTRVPGGSKGRNRQSERLALQSPQSLQRRRDQQLHPTLKSGKIHWNW